jgi:hypothetical protein
MARRPLQLISLAAPPPRLSRNAHEAALLALLRRRRQLAPGAEARLRQCRRRGILLADVLLSHGLATPADLLAAEAELRGGAIVDPTVDPPDPRLIDRLGPAACLAQGLLPWRRTGHATVIATCRPDLFARREAALVAIFGPVVLALAEEQAIADAVFRLRARSLVQRAETLVPEAESCRSRQPDRLRNGAFVTLAGLAASLALAPGLLFGLVMAWAALTLLATAGLKAAAALAEAHARFGRAPETPPPAVARLPPVSLLVPLFHEPGIAPRLIARLDRLDYPRELLDVLLIVEAGDEATLGALAGTALPPWMRVIEVPDGKLKTKPRALNYALPFCRGSIVGVYDAEDAPARDQLRRVVERFHACGLDVACLQGVLDFYNPRTNWLSRCFTVEYAAWFRIVLPGLARLGFTIPLGGTTLFFRRAALEALGGWDAHNVTEDADLGLRLARHGYRTELIDVVTEEEANCRPLPWIRQRSRWLKGYMMTWAVHMRSPRQLLAQLGLKRFLGIQVLFLGTISQFLLAPLLWSCWLMFFGLPHPLGALPGPLLMTLASLFVAAEVINIVVNLAAVSGPRHRHLIPWVPTLAAYFPLAALAAYKGAWEILGRPFFWDKTRHGIEEPDEEELMPPEAAAPEPEPELLTAT